MGGGIICHKHYFPGEITKILKRENWEKSEAISVDYTGEDRRKAPCWKPGRYLGCKAMMKTESEASPTRRQLGKACLCRTRFVPCRSNAGWAWEDHRAWWCVVFLHHLTEKHTLCVSTPWYFQVSLAFHSNRMIPNCARTLAVGKSSLLTIHRQRTSSLQQLLKITKINI